MLLHDVVDASAQIAATGSRTAKTELAAGLLTAAGAEVELVASYLAGTLPQRRTGVGWRSLGAGLPDPATDPTVTVAEVDAAMEALAAASGAGSAAARRSLLDGLIARLTTPEQRFVAGLMTGELRQGASDGTMLAAIAHAAGVPAAAVRRAAMLAGRTGEVARIAMSEGLPGLEQVALVPGRPLRPMLAGAAPDVASALGDDGTEVVVDVKLDGIRVQAHRTSGGVRLFTRSLEEITDRLPEVVEVVEALEPEQLVLDGEVVALDASGRPLPFQVTGARTASTAAPAQLREQTPLTVWFFDVLHAAGNDLIDAPLRERLAHLERVVPPENRIGSLRTADPEQARDFFDRALADGHEGVVVKRLDAPYAAGRRGAGWVKIKPRHTLDLVVLAVERGSGRRSRWLSNIHLGARDPDGGGFVMLGKTFKGMTDEILAWQTQRFAELATGDDGHVVTVRPEQVVEIAFDGVQRSSRYPAGMALRFARVLRYRDDKSADQADTVADVRRVAQWAHG